jgi:hypothetical protein
MRRLALLLLLSSCGADPAEPQNQSSPTPAPVAAVPAPSTEELQASRAAAAAVADYYEAIARRDYSAAWRLREPRPGDTLERFAAGFAPYADYRATVGMPTLPARQDGALWVAVPVQLYGRRRDGAPFGSVGRVTLKRAAGGDRWRIVG